MTDEPDARRPVRRGRWGRRALVIAAILYVGALITTMLIVHLMGAVDGLS
jgi:hypothetical protein